MLIDSTIGVMIGSIIIVISVAIIVAIMVDIMVVIMVYIMVAMLLLYALFNHPRLLTQVARVQKAQFSYRLDGLVTSVHR